MRVVRVMVGKKYNKSQKLQQSSFVYAEEFLVEVCWVGLKVVKKMKLLVSCKVGHVRFECPCFAADRGGSDSDHAEKVAPRECGRWDRGRMGFGEKGGVTPVEEAG